MNFYGYQLKSSSCAENTRHTYGEVAVLDGLYLSLNGNARLVTLKYPMTSLSRNVRPLVLEFLTPYFGFLLNLALFALCTLFL